jgi:hypothetical protein
MLYPIMEPKRPSAERKRVAPPASGAAALHLPPAHELPPPYVDERLVEPETRQEMVRGRLFHAAPANPEHGDEHTELDYLARGYLAPGYTASTDLLTRAGPESDFATDTCIRRSGIDPRTGSRYLEEVAFEVVNTQSLGHMVERAQQLTRKGVRRVFAIFVKKREVGEWSPSRASFLPLDLDGTIDDRTLIRPLPVRALFDTAVADDSIVDALVAKANPRLAERIAEGHAEGLAEGLAKVLLKLLGQRFGTISDATRARVETAAIEQLDAWTDRILTAATIDEVLAP